MSILHHIHLSIHQAVHLSSQHCQLRTCPKSPVIVGRKCSKLPAQNPTICPFLVHYVCHCTPICALSILSIHLSDDKCQEIPDQFPSTNYGERNQSKFTVTLPDNVTLTLWNVKFVKKTPGNVNGENT